MSICIAEKGTQVQGVCVCLCSAAGISRSVTITVAYLMTVSTLSFDDALKVVQYCREMANPNYGFRMQLQRFQEEKLLSVSLAICVCIMYACIFFPFIYLSIYSCHYGNFSITLSIMRCFAI